MTIAAIGAIAVGGMILYAHTKDSKDPFGYLSDLFTDIVTETPNNPNKATSINPDTGESDLQFFGK